MALGLSMDSFAVSTAKGIGMRKDKLIYAWKFGIIFGVFQMTAPLIGWFVGTQLRHIIEGIDHWIAFGILSIIGIKMIYEGSQPSKQNDNDNISMIMIMWLAVATSIDALAVGVSFAFLDAPMYLWICSIGIATFLLSFTGIMLGEKLGSLFGKKMEMAGGMILVAIGLKILTEHLQLFIA